MNSMKTIAEALATDVMVAVTQFIWLDESLWRRGAKERDAVRNAIRQAIENGLEKEMSRSRRRPT